MVDFITALPTFGDSEFVNDVYPREGRNDPWRMTADREPTLTYSIQFAKEAEKAGFDSVLIPVFNNCLDSLVTASALVSHTEKLKFLVASRTGFTAPATFARQLATLDYYSGGRAMVNIISGGQTAELRADGEFLDHEGRYRRTGEFMHVFKRLFTEDGFNHEGEFYQLENASLFYKSLQKPYPKIYFGGASQPGKVAAAKETDVYMLYAETLDMTQALVNEMTEMAAEHNRTLEFCMSMQIFLGETEEEAWEYATSRLSKMTSKDFEAKAEKTIKKNESVGERRLHDLMETTRNDNFRVGPNLWAGLTQATGGGTLALVGTPDQVADRLVEYANIGINKFMLRGYPILDTVAALGRDVIPKVHEKLAKKAVSQGV